MPRPRLLPLLRSTALRRFVALVVVVGLGGWAAAPLASADPAGQAAEVARAHAAGPLEAAVAEALAAAAHAADPAAAFENALLAALDAHPEGAALADVLRTFGPADVLLNLLVGHLLRAGALSQPLSHGFVTTATAPTAGPAPIRGTTAEQTATREALAAAAAVALPRQTERAPVSLREVSSAQPLGP